MVSNKEFKDAVAEYHAALDALNYVESEFFDTANARVTAAKAHIDALYKTAKKEADKNAE